MRIYTIQYNFYTFYLAYIILCYVIVLCVQFVVQFKLNDCNHNDWAYYVHHNTLYTYIYCIYTGGFGASESKIKGERRTMKKKSNKSRLYFLMLPSICKRLIQVNYIFYRAQPFISTCVDIVRKYFFYINSIDFIQNKIIPDYCRIFRVIAPSIKYHSGQ